MGLTSLSFKLNNNQDYLYSFLIKNNLTFHYLILEIKINVRFNIKILI